MTLLTPEAAGLELARVTKEIRATRAWLASHTKTMKGRIDALEERAEVLEAIANGEAQQAELDTTEATLRSAGEVASRKGRTT